MIRVVIADAQPEMRRTVRNHLDSSMAVVGEAASDTELLRMLQNTACDVLVLDLNVAPYGRMFLRVLYVFFPTLPVVVLGEGRQAEQPNVESPHPSTPWWPGLTAAIREAVGSRRRRAA